MTLLPQTALAACQRAMSGVTQSGSTRLFVSCGLLLIAAVVISTWFIVSNLRSRDLADRERELENVALVLAEQTSRAFQALDTVQSGIIERMQTLGITSADDYERRMSTRDVHFMLEDKAASMPQVNAITLINTRGMLINSSRSWPVVSLDVSDRDYFTALKFDANASLFLSEPVPNRDTGAWNIHLARKFVGPDGAFLGLVLGTVDLRYFERFFGRITLSGESSITLFRNDGVLLARHPQRDPPGTSYAEGGFFKTVMSHTDRGTIRLTSMIDGNERLVAGHKIPHYSLVVTVATTVRAALTEWRRWANYLIGAAVLIIVVIVGILALSIRQFKNYELLVQARAEKAEAEKLRQQKLQLDTALNNMSQGLGMFDAEARLLICNDLYIDMFGLSRAVVTPGCTLYDLIIHRMETGSFAGDPDKYAADILALVARGQMVRREVETTDGRVLHVVNRPMANGGWVVTHEDITDRRRAEQERDRNREFLDLIIDNVPATVFVKRASDRRYVLVNRAGEQFWGMPREEMLGKTAYDVFPREEAEKITERDERLLRSDEPLWVDEHPLHTPRNGTRMVISKRLVIRGNDGTAQYLLGVIEDVSELRHAHGGVAHLAPHDALAG
jgi:PAS domain S-box-containing protein